MAKAWKGYRNCIAAISFIFMVFTAEASTETGCKSFAADGFNIFYSNIGVYKGDPLYSRTGNQSTFSDIKCLQATGRGCFIRLTDVNECNNGCNPTPDANMYYYKPGTEYNFDPQNPNALCGLDFYGTLAVILAGAFGFYFIRKNF